MSTVKQLRVKAGDTLSWTGLRTDASGDPVPVGTVEACFARLGSLTVGVTDPAGNEFTVSAAKETTAEWAPGAYRGDVTFTGAGAESTETYVLIVERGYDC